MSHFLLYSGPADRVPGSAINRLSRVLGSDQGIACEHSSVDLGRATLVTFATATAPAGATDALRLVRQCTGATVNPGSVGVPSLRTGLVTPRTWWITRPRHGPLLSTSLRILAVLLGDLQFDEEATAWMLWTGTLGPRCSWDRRVVQVGASSEVDLAGGSISRVHARHADSAFGNSDRDDRLESLIRDALEKSDLTPDRWMLPLSGGVDSRGLALMLAGSLHTYTHGEPSSLSDPHSDLAVAVRLTREFGWRHEVIEIDSHSVPPETVLDRFLAASEGRIDHLSGYADGMTAYRALATRGVQGLVRGDEVFGWNRRFSVEATRSSVGALVPGDVSFPSTVADALDDLADTMSIPSEMVRKHDQTLAGFRDQLYRAFRLPSVLAPLTEIKSSVLDITNPLLADSIVRFAVSLGDRERTDKAYWRAFVTRRCRGVPFATRAATTSLEAILGAPEMKSLLLSRLQQGQVLDAGVPEQLVQHTIDRLSRPHTQRQRPRSARPYVGSSHTASSTLWRSVGATSRRSPRNVPPCGWSLPGNPSAPFRPSAAPDLTNTEPDARTGRGVTYSATGPPASRDHALPLPENVGQGCRNTEREPPVAVLAEQVTDDRGPSGVP